MQINTANKYFVKNNIIIYSFLIVVLFFFNTHLSYAQDLSKKVSIKMKDKPLNEVINEISKQGNINFSYSSQIITIDKRISIKAKNKSIKEILDEVLLKNGIDYLIIENQVILKQQKKETYTKPVDSPKAKTKFTISGYLKDKFSGEILIGAYVYAKGTLFGTTTNSYGFYSLTLPEGIYQMVFSLIGYTGITQNIELKENQKISVELEVAQLNIKEVEIIADNKESELRNNQLSEVRFSLKTLSQLPGFVGDVDIIKSLQAVPGIRAYGDGSSLFYVRGGNSDQNLLLIDEAPIYNPAHLFGFFSAIAPDAIKDVEAFKGDFPVNYGGRLSSVIDIRIKDGNMKRFGFSGSLGPYTSDLSLEGPIARDRSSFFVSVRKSNLNWLANPKTSDKSLNINFYDLNTKLNLRINDNNRFYISLYSGKDDFSKLIAQSKHTFGISWDNILSTFRWNHIFNSKLFSNTTFYTSKYNYYLHIWKEMDDYWNSSISNNAIKTDLSWYVNNNNTVKTGIEIGSHSFNPGNVHFSDNEIQKYTQETPKYSSREYDFYLSNEQQLTPKVSMRYGLRILVWQDMGETTVYLYNANYQVMDTLKYADKSIYSTNSSIEPRFNFKYSISKLSAIKISYSRTTQFIQLLTNSNSPFTSLDVWVPCGTNIKPQKANQYALGYYAQFGKKKINLSIETFYKQFYNQIDYKDQANLLYNPLIEGELRFGKAWSYGVEFMLRKTEGKLTGWVGYTYSRAFKQTEGVNNGNTYPASYDSPHNICSNISYETKRRWAYSANWIYYTGSAISTPISFYYYNGYSVPIYGDKNNDRLPNYHRLDLSITFKLSKPERHYQHSIIFTLYNAYARNNPIVVNFNKIMTDNGKFVVPTNLNGDYEIIPTTLSVAGRIPALTYNFKF